MSSIQNVGGCGAKMNFPFRKRRGEIINLTLGAGFKCLRYYNKIMQASLLCKEFERGSWSAKSAKSCVRARGVKFAVAAAEFHYAQISGTTSRKIYFVWIYYKKDVRRRWLCAGSKPVYGPSYFIARVKRLGKNYKMRKRKRVKRWRLPRL